jgi:DNA-binding beta-propeller fold protein YncE
MSGRGVLRFGVFALLVYTLTARAQIVFATVDVGEGANALAIDTIDDKVFVSCEGADSVYVLDPTADEPEEFVIGKVPVGDYPTEVVWNHADNTIWVVNKQPDSATGSVTAIDAANDSAVATIEVGIKPTKAVWASIDNKLYTLEFQTVTAIDCSTRQEVGTIRIPDSAYYFTDMVYNPSMNRLYLISKQQQGAESYLHVVDCTIDQIVQSVGLSHGAVKACFAPNVNRLFVACSSCTLDIIDCASNLVIAWLPIRDDPRAIIWSSPPNNRVWIACGWGHAVFYMQADELEIEGRIDTPNRVLTALLYDPYTTKLFATSYLTHEIMVINARIPGIIDTIKLYPYSEGPYAMALYIPMNRVFVANYWPGKGSVTVLWDFVGIEETPGKQAVLTSRAMPNPVSPGKSVMLQASGFVPTQAILVDATGRAVYQGDLGRNGALVAPETPGVYFYALTDGSQTSSGRLTVR